MRESGKVTGFILKELENFIKPGISTADINRFVEDTIRKNGMIPTFKGYCGFPASACVSINEEVVHGIPDKKRILKEGDIVSVDVGSTYKGYVSDAARTYPVGKVSDIAQEADGCDKRQLLCRTRILQGRLQTVGYITCHTGQGRERRLLGNKRLRRTWSRTGDA